MKTFILLALALETIVAAPVQAPAPQSAALQVSQPVPQARPNDPRIHVIPYSSDKIVELRAALGYQLMIQFGADERIENVAIGDSLGWQITPNKKADLLFVKPMDKVPITNMTVVTNLRTYLFEMIAESPPARGGGRSVTYVVQFEYPQEKVQAAQMQAAAPEPPQVVNSAYSYTGSTKTLPTRIFDDGHSTYFQFHEGEDYPAIFSTDSDKGEAVVNSSIRSGYIVVDQVAHGFTLRRGNDVTQIFNDGYKDPGPGPQSPAPRKNECGTCLFSCWVCR